MTTDTSEKGLETLIMPHMTGSDGLAVPPNRRPRVHLPTEAVATSPVVPKTTIAPTP